MSEEDEFEYESDMGDDDIGDGDAGVVMAESQFYEAEDLSSTNPGKALELFRNCLDQLRQIDTQHKLLFRVFVWVIVLSCRTSTVGTINSDLDCLFASINSVSRNEAAEGLNQVIDALSSQSGMEAESLCEIYERILTRLWDLGQSMQRLWFTTAVRLTRLYLEIGENRSVELDQLLTKMGETCKQPDGVTDDIVGKGSQLLELYAIEIQRIAQRRKGLEGGYKKVKTILEKCNKANSAVSNPRSMAIIREFAGKIFMSEKRFEDAYNELFEAFRAYADTGSARAKLILKYVVLANMFCLSMINPFDSREARAYQDDPEVAAMVRLRAAYDSKDISRLEEVLADEVFRSAIDGFMNSYLDKLVYAIKLQALQKLSKAYMRVKLNSLGRQLNLDREILEKMLVKSIQDGDIAGLIDGEYLLMGSGEGPRVQEAEALLQSVEYLQKQLIVDLQSKWKETLGGTAV